MKSLFSSIVLLLLVSFSCIITSSEAVARNISIKWDIMTWTLDGYVAVVTAYNHQKQRSVPGWEMSWEWSGKEMIWSMMGAQTTYQGDCSKFRKRIPHSCVPNPTVVDLLPSTPYNQQIANCCKSGILKPGAISSFQLTVGSSGTSNSTVQMARNFMFKAPKQQYICGPTKKVRPTKFVYGTRTTQAMMTWNVTCVFKKAA